MREENDDSLYLLPNITAKTVFERAYSGETFYKNIVRESAEKFGALISILLDLFNLLLETCRTFLLKFQVEYRINGGKYKNFL